jgi:hypothetical protein
VSEDYAATIRRAAQSMREQHGPEHVRHEFWHSLATWLELRARVAERSDDVKGDTFDALKIATAYLGEMS